MGDEPLEVPDARTSMHVATVGVGSNLGDREAVMREAVLWIGARRENKLRACSSLYETEPVGRTDQGWFLNSVIQVDTSLEVMDFFRVLQECEARFGRTRSERWGPRVLDMDLLFFNDTVRSDAVLTVPHPRLAARRFVLEPLCEIAPDLVHPCLKKSASALLEELTDASRVVRAGGPLVT